MDLKAFSGDSFDVKDWINQAFKSSEAQKQGKEQYASSLVMKLQLLIAKLNASLEEQSESVCQNLPRVVRETESLQQEALLLQAKMAAVQEEIDKVNRETGSSMEALVSMDLLKARIQSTRKALKEADNWTTLSAEIEDAIDSGELQLIAEKLTGIQSSLKILSHVPDYEDRMMHVEGLKNRLEALASPQLVTAFNGSDAERSRFFVRIFSEMERSEQLLKYYRKCLKARILKSWERVVNDRQQETVLEWIKVFFEGAEAILKEQVTWFKTVFTNASPSEQLIQVLLEVFLGMEPRLDFCIEAALKQQDEPLGYLIEVKKVMNGHVDSWSSLFGSDQQAANLRELAKTFYAPFKSHTSKYAKYESAFLLSELVAGTQSSKDIIDELRNISLSVSKLVASFAAASKRCCELTEGCAFPGFKSALEDCLSSYLERYSNLMRRLDKRKSATNSWNILLQSLGLNQTSGDLLLQLEQLDITLSIDFLERTKNFLGSEARDRDRVLEQHHLFLLDSAAAEKLEEFHSSVRQGSQYPILASSLKIVTKLCTELQSSAFSIMFHPIQDELSSVSGLQTWASASAGSDAKEPEMPDFSFSPQEYITQIGQYLMTLPQHLEPYMTNENPALTRALQERVFPYCSGGAAAESGDENPADFLLACVARATCDTYQGAILKILALSPNSTKQLATDIGYLGDILEDLGHPLSEGLKAVMKLLRLPAKDYWVQSTGCPKKLVSTIRQMRNLSMA